MSEGTIRLKNVKDIISIAQSAIIKEKFIITTMTENSISAYKKGGLRKKTLLATGLVGGVVAGFHAHDESISVLKSGKETTISWSGDKAAMIARKIREKVSPITKAGTRGMDTFDFVGDRFKLLTEYVVDGTITHPDQLVLKFVNGERTIDEIAERSGFPKKATEEVVQRYIEKGIVRCKKSLTDEDVKEEIVAEIEDPLKLLKLRYAKGEITKEEYLEMKETLE